MIKTIEETMIELGIDEEKELYDLSDKELLTLYNACDEYIMEQCKEICKRVDKLEDWEQSDSETFEAVIAEAVEKLEKSIADMDLQVEDDYEIE